MSPRRARTPTCVVIWWGDIPSQVMVRDEEHTLKAELPDRFQHAIDRCAMGGGQAGSDSYLAGWTRTEHAATADLQAQLEAEVAELDARFPPEELERLIKAHRSARRASTTTDQHQRKRRTVNETVISSGSREVVLGYHRPFAIIGERINPTGRKILAQEMKDGDFSRVRADAVAQVEAGASVLDVNAGIPLADEPAILAEAVRQVQAVVDVPLSIDSSIVAALEAGLAAYDGKPLVNSVTGEADRLESVLPLVAKYGAAVVAITNDETGINEDPDVRFEIARMIVNRAADHGIPAADIVVDPLVMPIGAIGTAGRQVMALVQRLQSELGVNTTCGASNISFGLPNRPTINAGFLAMAIGAGLTSAITNALDPEVRQMVRAADVLTGNDPNCTTWITHNRPPDSQEEGAGRRRTNRRRGRGPEAGPGAALQAVPDPVD